MHTYRRFHREEDEIHRTAGGGRRHSEMGRQNGNRRCHQAIRPALVRRTRTGGEIMLNYEEALENITDRVVENTSNGKENNYWFVENIVEVLYEVFGHKEQHIMRDEFNHIIENKQKKYNDEMDQIELARSWTNHNGI